MPKSAVWKLNTSNQGKLTEFQRLFAKHGCTLSATQQDLREINADPFQVVAHKASQMDDFVIIEDTSLDVEGADVGVNIRWLLDHLVDFVGHRAQWKVLLAYRVKNQVFIYQGLVNGVIVKPQGKNGFGFDPVFLPEGATETLAQNKPDHLNARALAVDALIHDESVAVESVITEWNGPWQDH